MHLDQLGTAPDQVGAGVPDRIRVVGEGCGIENDIEPRARRFVQPSDDLTLGIALPTIALQA